MNGAGGNARTAMVCTVSPSIAQAEQTKKTLQFASQVTRVTNSVSINQLTDDKVNYLV
jgi:centromeric protein E